MTFPDTPLPVKVEMWTGQAWVDITAKTRCTSGNEIRIQRGIADEGGLEPSSMTLTLDNRTGDFNVRNPTGQYYGLIGRNTPIRVTLTGDIAGERYMQLQSGTTDENVCAFTQDLIHPSADIDVRVDVAMRTWANGAPPIGKWQTGELFGDLRSWVLLVNSAGCLRFEWSTDGTEGTVLGATSTVAAGLVNGQRKAIRATLDINNGAGGWTVTFYTADTIDGTWVQLGDPVTDTGTTSIYNALAPVEIGQVRFYGVDQTSMRVYAAQVLDGIGGSALINPDFRTLDVETEQFTDTAGVDWFLASPPHARIVDPGIRMVGEVSEWPVRWNVSGKDAWTPITAQGVLRRLQQGNRPARSPVRSWIQQGFRSVTAYWAMEDTGGTSFAGYSSGSDASPVSPMTYTGDAPDFAATGPFLGSDSVAVLGATTTLVGDVPVTSDGAIQFGIHLDIPSTTGWADNTPIVWIEQAMTSATTVGIWEVRYKSGSGGDLEVRALDSAGAQVDTSGTLDLNIDGKSLRLSLDLQNLSMSIRMLDDEGTGIDDTTQFVLSDLDTTHATRVHIAPRGGLTDLGVGQVSVLFGNNDVDDDALLSYLGESAAARANRLTEEAGVEPRLVGTTESTEANEPRSKAMGVQATPAKLLEALAETSPADSGLLFECRDELGLTFRPLRELVNQPVALELDYTESGEIAPDLEPTDDDQLTRNDVTVNRVNGSSAQYVDSTSRMGTAAPPDGVGPYETNVQLNLDSDLNLVHHASWRVHLGTWDEPRFPTVRINLAALAAKGKTSLMQQAANLQPGDRIRLVNLPEWVSANAVDLMVLGSEEVFGQKVWGIVLNTRPYGPWQVGTLADADAVDDRVQRAAGDSRAAIRSALTSSTTSVPFDPNIFRFTVDTDHFDTDLYPQMYWLIGGEKMAVTAIATTAATFVAAGTVDHDDNAAVTPADYAGGAIGDWVVVYAAVRDSTASLAISDSNYTFTELAQEGGLYLWAAVRTADTPAPTVTPSSGGAGDTVSAVVLGLRNMPTTLDLDDYVIDTQYLSNASAQNIAYPTLVAGHIPGRVVLILARKSDDWTGVAAPSGFTEDVDSSTTSGDDQGLYVAHRIDTTPARVQNDSLVVTGGASAVSEVLVVALAGGYQTATVTRSSNDVEKAHSTGATLAVDYPLVAAL